MSADCSGKGAAKAALFEDQTCWALYHPGDSVGAVVKGAGLVRFGVNALVPGGAEVVLRARTGTGTGCGGGCRRVHGGLGGERREVWNNNSSVSAG